MARFNSASDFLIARLLAVRRQKLALHTSRQYERQLGQSGWENLDYPSGKIVAWSRFLDDREFLVVVNGNGIARRAQMFSQTST